MKIKLRERHSTTPYKLTSFTVVGLKVSRRCRWRRVHFLFETGTDILRRKGLNFHKERPNQIQERPNSKRMRYGNLFFIVRQQESVINPAQIFEKFRSSSQMTRYQMKKPSTATRLNSQLQTRSTTILRSLTPISWYSIILVPVICQIALIYPNGFLQTMKSKSFILSRDSTYVFGTYRQVRL